MLKRKTVVAFLLICILLPIQLVFGTTYIGLERTTIGEVVGEGPWLNGWDNRVKITVNSTDIDANLTSFPVLIVLSNSSYGQNNDDVTFVFDKLGANSKKIALTTSDMLTETYVEVSKWDSDSELAWLHSNVSLSSVADTDLYLYYDNDHADNTAYVGDPDDAVTHNVWDGNYVLVTHMRDDPDTSHIRDSTLYANDGTKKGANEPTVTTGGKVDDAQVFDGDDDYVTISDSVSLDLSASFSISMWVQIGSYSFWQCLLSKNLAYVLLFNIDSGYLRADFRSGAAYNALVDDTTELALDTWYHVVYTYDNSLGSENMKLFVNGSLVKTKDRTGLVDNGGDMRLMSDIDSAGREIQGIQDEVYISNIARAPAWNKAEYESGRDHLIDFGSEESVPLYPESIVVTELTVNMTVRLYNSTGGLIASDQVGVGETNATLTISQFYRASTFLGEFRLYDDDDVNLLTVEFDDTRGGDIYRTIEPGEPPEPGGGGVMAIIVMILGSIMAVMYKAGRR